MTIKLFMFYVGGDCGNSNIELHDVRFSIGETAKSCYDDLRAQWWGTLDSLHIDSWSEINQVDGYSVTLSVEPFKGKEKLFFLNLGGYLPKDFEEVHKNILVVEHSQKKAIQKTLQSLRDTWLLPHKDSLMEVEKAVSISSYIESRNLYVHLIKIEEQDDVRGFEFISRYIRLNKESRESLL